MAGIETYPDARFVGDESDSVAEVFEGAADDVAASGHVLQKCDNSGGLAVCTIDVGG